MKSSMVHLPVSMIPEWYLEILLITIEYHSIPLTFSMVHLIAGRNATRINGIWKYHSVQLTSSMVNLPVSMIPEWYLEIPFITIEYHSVQFVPLTSILNGTLAGRNDTRMVFVLLLNTIQYH